MKFPNQDGGVEPRNKVRAFSLTAIAFAMSGALMTGCSSDSSSARSTGNTLPTVEEPPVLEVTGTDLKCDTPELTTSDIASTLEVDPLIGVNSIPSYVVSKDDANSSQLMGNAGNNLKRMYPVVPSQTPDGTMPAPDKDGVAIGDVHPILISYAEQVTGSYALGDGSADIGDPEQVDDMFVSTSMDNGLTWKKEKVGETSDKSSITVTWNSLRIPYPGHTHKPTMAVKGNNVLVAWNDKYCPSGNPLDLEQVDGTYPDDLYKVNGAQGSIDYEGVIAPNGKTLYEVPFSCVWTARGVLREDPAVANKFDIEWRQGQQLTTGTRDSNKIWIAAETVGFALTWQEDTEGLRSGKGAGPGEGYSGATTNHGTDIWYSHITMADFDNVCTEALGNDCDPAVEAEWIDDPTVIAGFGTKPKASHNFAYPVRITNNEVCAPEGDTKLYCTAQYLDLSTEATDDTYARNCIATVDRVTGQSSGQTKTVQRCVQDDLDYMTDDSTIAPAAAILDGDTGASRPALKILKTDADEFISVLVYEETKGLSESDAGEPDQGTDPTIIALEGKSVYFESFLWDQPVAVSAGRVVNPRVPEVTITKDETTNDVIDVTPTGKYIYENARRVVIAGQTDVCDAGDYTFGLLFKQGYETRGGPSDMFIVMNTGFTYDDFEVTPMLDFDGGPVAEVIVPAATNISSHETLFDTQDPPQVIGSNWDETYLVDQSYDIADDNTFSPRAFLRGYEIYTGFEFTSNWRQTSNGTRPNNFWVNRYVDDGDGIKWQGPQQVSITRGKRVSTLDPRFIRTPEGITVESAAAGADAELIAKDTSNPNVLFMSYGTFDMDTKEELDLYYTRSTDKGKTWEYFLNDGTRADLTPDTGDLGADNIAGTEDDEINLAKLAHKNSIEKEVQAIASPDGTMLFNAWLYESHSEACGDAFCGLESEYGVVEYDTPIVVAP